MVAETADFRCAAMESWPASLRIERILWTEQDSCEEKHEWGFFCPEQSADWRREFGRFEEEANMPLLADVMSVVDQSKSLLHLQANWDEEGAQPIAPATWRRAADFITRQAEWIWHVYGRRLQIPDVTPVPNGSIDLHWDYPSYELLINIPAELSAMAGFYGDDRGRISIEGQLDPEQVNEGLLLWLTRMP